MNPSGALRAGLVATVLFLAPLPAPAQSPQPLPGPIPLTPDAARDRTARDRPARDRPARDQPARDQPARDQPVVDLSLCQRLTRYVPAADVEYRPGVDVNGRAVTPADLPGSAGAQPPIPIDLPLSVDLARRMGVALPSVPYLPNDITAVWLSVVGDRLYLNGQPIDPGAEERLYAYCRTR